MDNPYPDIPGTSRVEHDVLPPPDQNGSLPTALTAPEPPIVGGKQIFAFWHEGIQSLPPYLRRNVVNWHRRFSPVGWRIFVLDTVLGSALNVANFIDTTSQMIVPTAFTDQTLGGTYANQHTSDLIRYPLLLRYGGVYLDTGILQFGDIDWLWTTHIMNPDSPYDFAGFTMGNPPDISIVNFTLVAGPDNPLIERAHRILLKIWEGKTTTTGAHMHPLVNHIPLLRVPQEVVVIDEIQGQMVIDDAAMTDYAIQIQCMGAAQHWVDEQSCWNGPQYVREKCWLLTMMEGCYAPERLTNWNGRRLHDLLSLPIPRTLQAMTEDQILAQKIVEQTIAHCWCFKLGHGFSAKLFGGDTVGMLWKKSVGSDAVEGTYAGWLRWAEVNRQQNRTPDPFIMPVYKATMVGDLSKIFP